MTLHMYSMQGCLCASFLLLAVGNIPNGKLNILIKLALWLSGDASPCAGSRLKPLFVLVYTGGSWVSFYLWLTHGFSNAGPLIQIQTWENPL